MSARRLARSVLYGSVTMKKQTKKQPKTTTTPKKEVSLDSMRSIVGGANAMEEARK